MTSLIDHTARKRLGIGAIDMLVLDACDRLSRNYIVTTEIIVEQIGLQAKTVNETVARLNSLNPRLLVEFEPTKIYYDSFVGEVEVPKEELEQKAIEIMNMFNELTGRKFSVPNNILLVKKILQSNKKITKDHFKSIITHKLQVWTKESGMDMYIQPTTLFRSPNRFATYYDQAQEYWMIQQKKDSYARATGIIGN
jgi:uncharacterized phage protein (TIGR02220 family)